MNLENQIEAILFYKTEPVKKGVFVDLLGVSVEEIESALAHLAESLANRGIRLTITDTHVQLVTAPELSELIEKIRKEELSADIGKAGAEALAIILYRGPLSRSDIDRIRGVNSSFILRNLLIRGLIERRIHPTDARSFIYACTPSLFNHLGVSRREELPEFVDIMNALDTFEKTDDTSTTTDTVAPTQEPI